MAAAGFNSRTQPVWLRGLTGEPHGFVKLCGPRWDRLGNQARVAVLRPYKEKNYENT